MKEETQTLHVCGPRFLDARFQAGFLDASWSALWLLQAAGLLLGCQAGWLAGSLSCWACWACWNKLITLSMELLLPYKSLPDSRLASRPLGIIMVFHRFHRYRDFYDSHRFLWRFSAFHRFPHIFIVSINFQKTRVMDLQKPCTTLKLRSATPIQTFA